MKKAPYLGVMVIAAFISFISAMQIDSAFSDERKLNTVFLIGSILFGLLAIGALIGATKTPKR